VERTLALSLLVFTLYDPFSGHSKLLTYPLLNVNDNDENFYAGYARTGVDWIAYPKNA
jgi:hypothetical protein